MASNSVITTKLISIVLIAVGAGLVYWGYEMSGSIGSQLTETITGSAPDNVMVRYIAGGACLAAGIYLFIKR